MENLYKTKVRLQIKKNKNQLEFNKIITLGLQLANEINYTGIVKSRVKKLLKDGENMKKLEELEKDKYNFQSTINDIIELNRQFLFLKNPIDIFIYLEIFKFEQKKIKGKKKKLLKLTDKYKHLDDNLKKKVLAIGDLYFKIEKFNTRSSLKHFIEPLSLKDYK